MLRAVSLQTRMNSSSMDVPSVHNTGQIRQHDGPVHSVLIVNTEKVVDDTSPMKSGVVVLKYRVSDWHLAQKRQHMRRQNFVDGSLKFPSMNTRSVVAVAEIPAVQGGIP